MRELVTDTHSLLWQLYLPRRLGRRAREAFREADEGDARIHVPSVVVAEALMVAEKKRLEGLETEALLEQFQTIRQSDNYRLGSLSPETVLTSPRFDKIPDIFDRLIVAEAHAMNLPLISKDALIRESGLIEVIWE